MEVSTRHYQMRDLVKEREEKEKLMLRDGDGEATVAMDTAGMNECSETEAHVDEKGSHGCTVVANGRTSMRHAPSLKLKSGICLEAATLVVARPSCTASDDGGDAELATEADATASGEYDKIIREKVTIK
ncbi:F-box protein AUF1-like [Raphanus sativus]|uniref:F-box protein AUF1-like n=1 Tax=Raphanus sativus TaxID=3726 RepID=A0A9W3CAJ2_RAPSA|nr:F-box protein AUF1-like [Raphanus sativus]